MLRAGTESKLIILKLRHRENCHTPAPRATPRVFVSSAKDDTLHDLKNKPHFDFTCCRFYSALFISLTKKLQAIQRVRYY